MLSGPFNRFKHNKTDQKISIYTSEYHYAFLTIADICSECLVISRLHNIRYHTGWIRGVVHTPKAWALEDVSGRNHHFIFGLFMPVKAGNRPTDFSDFFSLLHLEQDYAGHTYTPSLEWLGVSYQYEPTNNVVGLWRSWLAPERPGRDNIKHVWFNHNYIKNGNNHVSNLPPKHR